MQDKMQDDEGNIWEVDASGEPVRLVQRAPSMQRGRVFTLPTSPKDTQAAELAAARLAEARARAAEAPLDQELKREQINNARNPRSAPPSGYRFTASGDLEPIPGGPVVGQNGVKKGNGALDAIVKQINDVSRQFATGPGATSGLGGLWDYLPTSENKAFDAAAAGLEDQAAMAFRVPGSGTVSDADAARIAAANKPNRWDMDAANVQRLKQLRVRVDAAREAAGLPPANWEIPGGDGSASGEDAAATQPPSHSGGPTVGGPGRLLAPDEMVRFAGDAAPPTGKRYTSEQEGQIAQAIRDGDLGQALSLHQRFSGNPPDDATIKSTRAAIDAVRKNPDTPIGVSYGGVDAYAQTEADRKRFGDELAPAMEERKQASAVDVGARAGANGLTAGLADYLAATGGWLGGGSFRDNLRHQQAMSEADARLSPTTSFMGNIVGGAAGAALSEGAASALLPARAAAWAPRLGDAFYGATAGATGAAPGEEATGAATGGLGGVLGGVLGRNAVRGVGNVSRGARDASADFLRQRGVPLTVGQLVGQGGRVGQAVKGIEDRLTSVPIIGDMINARRREGLEAFNRSAFGEGLGPIAPVGPRDIAEQGIEQGQQAVSDAYTGALQGVQASADAPFITDMQAAMQRGAQIPRTGPEFEHVVNSRLAPMFDAGNGTINGRAIQDALQGLRKADYGSDAMGAAARDATSEVEDALTGLISRQAPDVMPRLNAANGAYRNLSVLADAVGKGANTGGVFTPAQLGMAARANATKYTGKMNAATTNRPFFDLQRAGQDVLPSAVPDSGTAGRVATLALPGILGGAGAGAGYLTGDAGQGTTAGLALGSLLAAGGTRNGQRLLAAILADRPDALVRIGEQLNRRAGIGGVIGAPILAGAGSQ